MTKEQEEIEKLKNFLKLETPFNGSKSLLINKETIDTVLNMIKEKNAEIEKKEKMIDLLLDFIYKMSIIRPGTIMYDLKGDGFDTNKCGYCKDKSCKDCIKQYFERKAEQSSSKTQEKN